MVCRGCGKKLGDGLSFCPRCGEYLRANQYGKVTISTINSSKKEKKANGVVLYLLIFILWAVGCYFVIRESQVDYYFIDEEDTKVESTGGENNPVENDEPNNAIKEGNGITSIVYNRKYLKQFSIKNEDDVYSLIIKDSVGQKKSCSEKIRKIEDSIISNYGITAVNLCEIDEEFALEIKNIVGYIYDNYPSARGYLTNLTLANLEENTTYMAAFMPIFTFATSNTSTGYPMGIKTQIILNAKYYLNTVKLLNSVNYGVKSGYFPKNANRGSTLVHEFGHYISYVAMLNYYHSKKLNFIKVSDSNMLFTIYDDFNVGDFSKKIIMEAHKKYTENGNMISFDAFRGLISQYALAKDKEGNYIYDETIAEAFHDVYLNGSGASKASLLIMDVLNSYL